MMDVWLNFTGIKVGNLGSSSIDKLHRGVPLLEKQT